jgi:tRNA threonylcarbamoyl adenosine modification protein (Sua5/YciO/YrdC/YwlC family)
MDSIMTVFLSIHPENPQARLVNEAVLRLVPGAVMACPTDSGYALTCRLDDKAAYDKIKQIRALPDSHFMTLLCHNLSSLGHYAILNDNQAFRWIKAHTPGAYTFILKASKSVPKRVMQKKRKTIGLRIPDNVICQSLLSSLGEPLMSCSLILPDETDALADPWDIRDRLSHQVDIIIDGGYLWPEPTTRVDCVEGLVVET